LRGSSLAVEGVVIDSAKVFNERLGEREQFYKLSRGSLEFTLQTMECRSKGNWPKVRPVLTESQQAIYEDWEKYFLGTCKPGRLGWSSRFDHRFAARTAAPRLRTLEIGAGTGTHLEYETEGEYIALEGSETLAAEIPKRDGLSVKIVDVETTLPFDDDSFDRVLAIHVLEHLYNLPATLDQVARVLKPRGVFVVLIPCEGGSLYTLGRRFTTKRTFEKRYDSKYDWLIRHDHCNTAREILHLLFERFAVQQRTFFPLGVPLVDVNVIIGLELGLRHNS
jgi:SAM-dependent methyltransferase